MKINALIFISNTYTASGSQHPRLQQHFWHSLWPLEIKIHCVLLSLRLLVKISIQVTLPKSEIILTELKTLLSEPSLLYTTLLR